MNAQKWLKRLKIWSVALVDKPANPEARVVLAKAADAPETWDEDDEDEDDEQKKQKKAMPGMADVHVPGMMTHPQRKGTTMPDLELVKKIETLEAERKIQTAALEKAEGRLADIEKARRQEVYLAKARTYQGIPGWSVEDFATILAKIDAALSPEEQEKVSRMLASVQQMAKQSVLLREIGRDGSRGGDATSAGAQLVTMAQTLMKADPKHTFATAFQKVLMDNKALYDQYDEEKGHFAVGGH